MSPGGFVLFDAADAGAMALSLQAMRRVVAVGDVAQGGVQRERVSGVRCSTVQRWRRLRQVATWRANCHDTALRRGSLTVPNLPRDRSVTDPAPVRTDAAP